MIQRAETGEDLDEDFKIRKDPIKDIIELEARIADREASHQLDINGLKKELGELKESIKDLIVILEALKSFAKVVGYFERALVFCTKFMAGAAIIYGIYKFSLTELATRIKSLGGS